MFDFKTKIMELLGLEVTLASTSNPELICKISAQVAGEKL